LRALSLLWFYADKNNNYEEEINIRFGVNIWESVGYPGEGKCLLLGKKKGQAEVPGFLCKVLCFAGEGECGI
jgi:hypothetical protein